jgi:hypothetical protein
MSWVTSNQKPAVDRKCDRNTESLRLFAAHKTLTLLFKIALEPATAHLVRNLHLYFHNMEKAKRQRSSLIKEWGATLMLRQDIEMKI